MSDTETCESSSRAIENLLEHLKIYTSDVNVSLRATKFRKAYPKLWLDRYIKLSINTSSPHTTNTFYVSLVCGDAIASMAELNCSSKEIDHIVDLVAHYDTITEFYGHNHVINGGKCSATPGISPNADLYRAVMYELVAYGAGRGNCGALASHALKNGASQQSIAYGAAENNHTEVIDTLTNYSAKNYNDIAKAGASNGHIDVVKLAIRKGANNYGDILYEAATKRYMKIVIYLAKNYESYLNQAK